MGHGEDWRPVVALFVIAILASPSSGQGQPSRVPADGPSECLASDDASWLFGGRECWEEGEERMDARPRKVKRVRTTK